MEQDPAQAESKRDRVRRLLIGPMDALGFRKPGSVKLEDHRRNLDRIADELAYMSDEGFARLVSMLRGKGDGKLRDAWPLPARVIGFAELVEPRPIEELPALLRWFRSEAGRRADAAGQLVEEYAYWTRHKHPPTGHRAQMQVAERAEANRRRAELAEDRIDRNVDPGPGEAAWLSAYRQRRDYLRGLVHGG